MDSRKDHNPTRRSVLKSTVAGPLFGALGRAQQTQPVGAAVYAYVGCFTTAQRNGRGDGIHVCRVDPETGAWSHIQRLGNLVNPSFLVLGRDQRFLYSVHGDEKYATSF